MRICYLLFVMLGSEHGDCLDCEGMIIVCDQ